jgi:hypothetical protein
MAAEALETTPLDPEADLDGLVANPMPTGEPGSLTLDTA